MAAPTGPVRVKGQGLSLSVVLATWLAWLAWLAWFGPAGSTSTAQKLPLIDEQLPQKTEPAAIKSRRSQMLR